MPNHRWDPNEMDGDDWSSLSLELEHYFTPGTPIKERDLILGRQSQIQQLVRCCRVPGKHAAIYGERGVGKSSIGNTFHMFIDGERCNLMYIRVQATSKDNFSSLWFNVFKRIRSDGQRLSDSYKDTEITPDDVLLEFEKFNASDRPIVVLDEIDRLSTNKAKSLMSDTLKALSDATASVTVVCIGIAETVGELIVEHESVGRALMQIEMPRMASREIRDIVAKRYRKCGLLLSKSAVDRIVFISKGMPYYAHLLGLHAGQAACERGSIVVEMRHVEEGIERSFDEVSQSIRQGYDSAVYSDQKEVIFKEVLLACALADRDNFGRFSARSIEEQLNKIIRGKEYNVSAFSYHLKSFCDEKRGNILERFGDKGNFRYRFREALMEPYVVAQSLQKEIVTEEQLSSIIPQQIPDLFPT